MKITVRRCVCDIVLMAANWLSDLQMAQLRLVIHPMKNDSNCFLWTEQEAHQLVGGSCKTLPCHSNLKLLGTFFKDRSFLHLVKVNQEVNQAISQSQTRIPWLNSWLTLTRCRKDRTLDILGNYFTDQFDNLTRVAPDSHCISTGNGIHGCFRSEIAMLCAGQLSPSSISGR